MNKILMVIALVLAVIANAQNVGKRLVMGSTFTAGAEYTILSNTDYATAASGDTVLTGLEYLGKLEGIYGVTFYGHKSSGTPTFNVEMREYFIAAPADSHWTIWNTVFSGAAADSLYRLSYDGTTPSWWAAAHGNGMQYRVTQVGAGAAVHYISHFVK